MPVGSAQRRRGCRPAGRALLHVRGGRRLLRGDPVARWTGQILSRSHNRSPSRTVGCDGTQPDRNGLPPEPDRFLQEASSAVGAGSSVLPTPLRRQELIIHFSLAAGPSSLRSSECPHELRRTRRSLGEGGHPQRELTLMPRLGSPCPRLGMAAGAPLPPIMPTMPILPLPPRFQPIL